MKTKHRDRSIWDGIFKREKKSPNERLGGVGGQLFNLATRFPQEKKKKKREIEVGGGVETKERVTKLARSDEGEAKGKSKFRWD